MADHVEDTHRLVGTITAIAATDSDVFFATTDGEVSSVPAAGGAISPICAATGVIDMSIEGIDVLLGTDAGRVGECPMVGGPLTLLSETAGSITSIAVDPTALYWITIDGDVYTAPRDGGDAVLAGTTVPLELNDIALAPDAAYWASMDGIYKVVR